MPAKTVEERLTALEQEFAQLKEQLQKDKPEEALARTPALQIEAYVRLKRHLPIYCKIAVIQYDDKAAAEFERLKQAKIRIGTMDLKIAAIALANDAILPTRNLVDFSRVPGVKAEDWSI